MVITITRKWYTNKSTVGEIAIDGESVGLFSLEDVVRMFKIFGETAIPAGKYMANITYSARFNRYMLELIKVPGFSFVRIHPGNTNKDTEGCILIGESRSMDVVYSSQSAYKTLWTRILKYINDAMVHIEPIWVEIIDTQKPKVF